MTMATRPDIQADKDAIVTFLATITSGWDELPEPASLELRCLFPGRSADIQRFAPTQDGFSQLADHAAVMNQHGLNAYVVVNPVRASAPIGRGAGRFGACDDDILAAFYFWADGDDEEAANSIRNFAGPKWTMAVTTGRVPSPRPHIYWRCDEPIYNLPAWTGIQKAIAARLSTDRTVVNPSRIMRLPGTVNWPTDQKAAKGRVPEIATLRTDYDDDRDPVTFEQMLRAFGTGPSLSQRAQQVGGLTIDTGPQAMDREAARIKALSGQEWHNEIIRLVASYVSKGLQDHEIHALTDQLTLRGYTVEQTRREVQTAIDGARRKGWEPKENYTPHFDHAPAPSASQPTPAAPSWAMLRADAFTSAFVAPEYLIDGVVQRGKLYTLTAPTGSGKTAVMLYASTSIATGTPFCDHEVEHGDVIFLAGENPDDVRARVIATLDFGGGR